MNADEIHNYVAGLQVHIADLDKMLDDVHSKWRAECDKVMKLTKELADCRASLRHAVSNEATAARRANLHLAALDSELGNSRDLRQTIDRLTKELEEARGVACHTFTVAEVAGWLASWWSGTHVQWLKAHVGHDHKGIAAWKASQK